MANISIIARSGTATSTISGESASVISPSIVKIKINPQDIAELNRSGNNLIVTLKDGEKITIENFYAANAQGIENELVFEDQNGALWWVQEPEAGLQFSQLEDIDALMIEQSSSDGAWPWILGALAVGGGIAVAAGSGGGGGHHHDDTVVDDGNGTPPGTGTDPGTDPGTNPGTDPGTDPGPGTSPELTEIDSVANLVITDDVEQITGPIARGGFTNDNTPTLSGTTIPGGIVTIYDGNTKLGSVQADASGAWRFTPQALPDGVHSFTTTVSNGSVTSASSGAFVVTIDTSAPDAVSMMIVTDNLSPVLGTIAAGGVTNDNTPVLSGKAEPGSTVNIYDGATLIGSVVADAQGNWGLELSEALGDGAHSLTANATDLAGNVGPSTPALDFTVDTTAPAAMGGFQVVDDVGTPSGALNSGDSTDDSTPTFSGGAGSVAAGDTIKIWNGDVLVGQVKAEADGSWSFTPDAPLAGGTYQFTTSVTDAAGNESERSGGFTLTIAPPLGDITGITVVDDVETITGALTNGAATNDAQPTFSGKATPGSAITVYLDGQALSVVVETDLSGNWSFTPASALADGRHSFTFSSDDGATLSEPFVINVDTTAPNPVAGMTVIDDLTPGVGQITNGGATNDGTPIISGTAEAGSTVSIYDGADLIGTVQVGDDGKWGFSPETAFTEGTHHLITTVTDPAGNVSAPSPDFVLVVDTAAPETPSLFIATDNNAPEVGTINAGDVTNDSTPVLSGKAEPGSRIVIYDKGVEIASTLTDANGNWGLELTTPLSDEAHGLTVVAFDAAGNASQPSAELVFSVDTAAPVGVSSLTVTDDIGPSQGTLTSGSTTDDTLPTFTGRAEPNSTVSIYEGTQLLGTAVVNGAGDWTFTPSAPLASGLHQFTMVVTDAAGNASAASSTFELTIAPVAGPVTGVVVTDNVDPEQGTLSNGDATNDSTPTFTGSAAPDSTLTVYDNGVAIATVPVDASGNWSYTPSSPLGEGDHSITFTVDNGSGASAPSEPFVVTVDTTAPLAVADMVVVDDRPSGIGQLTSGGQTNDGTPVFSGTAEPGSTVTLYDGSTIIGTVQAGSDGRWGFIPETPLADGSHTITTTVTDAAGNVGAASPGFVLGVDTTAPDPVTLYIATDNQAPVVGNIVSGAFTNDNTPLLSGKAEPGAQVVIYDGENEIARATADALGNWGLELTTPLADGAHSLTAVAMDAAGNASAPTAAIEMTVDTQTPQAVTDLIATDNVGDLQGPLTAGSTTDDTQPTFSGTAEAGGTINVYDNGALIGTAQVNDDLTWTFTPEAPLSGGAHSITVTVTDKAGNVSASTPPFTLNVAPAVEPVTGVTATDDVAPTTGNIANGGSTNDTLPTFSGNATAGINDTIYVYDNGVQIGTIANSGSGPWTWTPDTALGEGQHSITFVVDDGVSQSAPSQPYVITVDTTVPDPVGNLSVVDDLNPGIGQVEDGGATNDTTPIISGTAEPGTTVTVLDDGNVIGTVTVGADGQWGFIPETPLGAGQHPITTTVTDAAGNVSAESPPRVINIDTDIPNPVSVMLVADDRETLSKPITNGGITGDNTPFLSGQAEVNATVSVYDGTTLLGYAQADNSGYWSFTPGTPLSDGQHSLITTVTDAAGNTSIQSPPFTFTVDTTAPAMISAITVTDNQLPTTGAVSANDSINDNQPTLSGRAEAYSTVNIFNGTALVATTQADASGNWSVKPTTPLDDGDYTLTATSVDLAGNTSMASPEFSFTIDTTAPDAITDLAVSADGTLLANGGSTNDTTPSIGGVGEEGSTITVYDTDGTTVLGTTVAGPGGAWSIDLPVLDEGPHTLTAKATDAAGNESLAASVEVVIDTAPPATLGPITVTDNQQPTVGPVTSGADINDPSPILSGTADPFAIINVYNGATLIGSGQADELGNWRFAPDSPLPDGNYSLTATATDAAGNVSAPSPAFAFSVDTRAPDTIDALIVTDDVAPGVGIIANGGSTNDTTPTFSGKVEAGATITLYNGQEVLGVVVADDTGNWSFTPEDPLDEGSYRITATVTDLAGNVSDASVEFVIELDTSAPTEAPTFTVNDDLAPGIGAITSGDSTNDPTPTFSGTAEPGSIVTLYNGTTVIGTAEASDTDGSWTFTPETNLTDGEYTLTARATDAAGNVGPESPAFSLIIDTTPPANVTNLTVNDDAAPVSGLLNSGDSTNDSTPTFSGRAEAGSTIIFYNDGVALPGTAVADSNGVWTYTPTLVDGDYRITTTVTDKAGNVSTEASPVFTLNVDTGEPEPTGGFTITDNREPESGVVGAGASINDPQPTLSGTAEPNSSVILFDNNVWVATIQVNEDGEWSYTPTSDLAQGSHSFTTVVEDKAGNQSDASAPQVIIVDTVAPAAVTGLLVDDNVAGILGPVSNNGTTNDPTPTFSGVAEAGTTVSLYEGERVLGEVQVGEDGKWSIEAAPGEGQHTVTVVVTDAAGNVSTDNPQFTLTIDSIRPDAILAISATDNVDPQSGTFNSGGFTNDTTPAFSGFAEAGSTVSVYDGVTLLGTTTASASDGSWSFTPTSPLAEGAHSITATATDAAGNEGPASPAFTFTVDTVAPGPISNLTVVDSVAGGVTGTLTAGGLTNDNRPVLSGNADPGSTVTIYNGTTFLGTAVASDTDGSWTFETPELADATYNFITTVTDRAGNVSTASPSFTLTVDTTAPATPVNIIATDNEPLYTGTVPASGLTNDRTPTLSGVVEPNATVTIYRDDVAIDTVTANAAGQWTYTSPSLTDGSYTFNVTATDTAGNTSEQSADLTLNIDGTAPAAIAVLLVSDVVLGSTSNNQPTFTSVALTNDVGAIINIYDGDVLIGSTTVGALGIWSFTPDAPLRDGNHTFTARVQDAAGNESAPSVGVSVFIDSTTVNGGITELQVTDDVGPIQTTISSGGYTDDTLPTFSGSAQANTTITFYDNGGLVPIGTALVDEFGRWTFTPTVELTDGPHLITTTVTNGVTTTPPAALIQFTVDTSAPADVTALVVTDDVAPGVGAITNGGSTNDAQPTFSGSIGLPLSEVGSTVVLREGDTVLGSATLGASGLWTITPNDALTDGLHNLTVVVIDRAGNESPGIDFALTVDATPPSQIIDFTVSDNVAPGLANVALNGSTNDTTPTLNGAAGSAEAGSILRIYDGLLLLGTTTVNGDGSWEFISPALLNGSHSLTITATDAAGNVSAPSAPFTFTVDTVVPAPILALAVSNNVGGPALTSGAVTNDSTPVISGRAEAGSTVRVYNGDDLIDSVIAGADGTWSLASPTLTDGTYILTATATDAAGNVGQASPPFTLTIDTAPPATPGAFTLTDNTAPVLGNVAENGTINDTRPVLRGAAGSVEGNALVSVYDGTTLLGTTRAQADGSWAFTPTGALGNTSHALSVTATDAAGNVSGSSPVFNVTVDTAAPTAPGVPIVTDDVGTLTGPVSNGGVTNDTLPLLSGTAEPGSTVTIYQNGVLLTTVAADATTGQWTFQTTTALAQGAQSFYVTATDAAGNVSLPSPIFSMIVDTTAPAPILTYTVTDDVSPTIGTLASGDTTNDSTPTIAGAGATPGATVVIMDGAQELGRTSVNALGIWSFTPTTALSEGPHSLTLTVVDAAGNASAATPAFNLTVDTGIPTAGLLPIVSDDVGASRGDLTSGARTDDNTPTLRGTVEAGALVNIYDGTTLLASVRASDTGAWSYTTAALNDGVHRFSTTVSDAAGNVSPASPVFTLTIDTTAPAAAGNITVSDNVGPVTGLVTNGGSTNDNTPTINGTAEANATVTLYNGNTVLTTVNADANGVWSYTPTVSLADGTYTLATTVTDQAGNVGPRSPDFVLTIDTSAPAAIGALTVSDDVNPVTGTLANNGYSNDNRPTIGGVSEVGATITVYDGTRVLGTTTAGPGGVWSYTPTVALADGVHNFTATATDAAGNVGPASPAFTLNIDTAAPAAITGLTVYDDVAADLGFLTSGSITNDTRPAFSGVAEANSRVNIYDNGVLVTTVTAGANGQWTWTPTTALSSTTHTFTFSATDAAGNEGPRTPAFTLTVDPTVGTQVLNAVNDEAGLTLTTSIQQVTAPSSTTAQNLNVLNLGVGELLTVNLIQSNQLPTFHVDEGASRALTLQASAGGVTLLSTFDLYIYKSNGDGTYSVYQRYDDFLRVLLLGGVSATRNITLPAGDYALLLKADDGLSLLTGSQLRVTSDVTTGVFVDTASGTATGNVMTGAGGGGVDSTPNGTVVSGVSVGAASSFTTVNATGDTVIQGTYGTLTINAQGGYSYALRAGVSPGSITGPDVFNYQIKAPNGTTSNATLTIDLNLPNLKATNDVVTLEVDPTPVTITTPGVSNTSLILASVSLGPILSADISTAGQLQVDVGPNATRTFTLSGSAVGVAVGATYDLYIYKYNATTGQYEQAQFLDNWIRAPLLVGSKSQSFTLGEGHYVFLLKADGLLSVATFATMATSNDVTQTYQAAVESVTGNVITGAGSSNGGVDVAPAGTVVSYVNGQAIAATGNTTITGTYGNLVINAQGVYTYTLRTGQPATALGQESFTYVIRNGSSVSTATLTISLPSVGSAAAQSMMVTSALVADESVVQSSTTVQAAQAATLMAVSSDAAAQGVTVQASQTDTMSHAALVLSFMALPGANGKADYQILDAQGHLISSGTLTADSATLTASIPLGDLTLQDGQYHVVLQDGAGNPLESEFSTVLTSVAVTPEAAEAGVTVEGQIVDIASALWASLTLSNESGQQITEIAGSQQSQTLEGLYGTLTLHADGSYSYTLREGISVADLTQREQFDYTLKAADGTLSHGSLTIDLHPHIEGSDKGDSTASSAYDDTWTLGAGGDTVIFNLLDDNDATGGNGHDNHWTDFSVSDGDHIDISHLLSDWSGKSEDLGQYLSIEHTASGDTVVSIDRDGQGSQYQPTQLITLDGVQPTLEELLHHDATANHG